MCYYEVMGRAGHSYSQPGLGRAIAWIRVRAQLGQRELVGRVEASGTKLHPTYLSHIERGTVNPSRKKLSALLAALAYSEEEFEALLLAAPWNESDPERVKVATSNFYAEAETKPSNPVYRSSKAAENISNMRLRSTSLTPETTSAISEALGAIPDLAGLMPVAAPVEVGPDAMFFSARAAPAPAPSPALALDARIVDPELQAIIDAWPTLTRQQQLTVKAIIDSYTTCD